MEKTRIDDIKIIGIQTRTVNDGAAEKDLPALWERFMTEQIMDSIPNLKSDKIYCLYTNYEGDHTQPYDVILGCQVSTTEEVPKGMVKHEIKAGDMAKFTAKGSLVNGEAVVNTWYEIWKADIDRSFTTDFEVYDERSENRDHAEVDIFIALNSKK